MKPLNGRYGSRAPSVHPAEIISGGRFDLIETQWNRHFTQQQQLLRQHAVHQLRQAGAHYVNDSDKDLLPCIETIEQRMKEGEHPC